MYERILVVEDHPSTLGLLTRILQKSGYEVIRAQNGEQALQILSTDLPDIILLDLTLTGIDGSDICKDIKSDPVKQHIPIVMCVPKADLSEKAGQEQYAPDVYISKPFAAADLVAQIKAQLRIKMLEDRLQIVSRELQTLRRRHQKQAGVVEKSHIDTIHCLLAAAEAKDPYISGHAGKVAALARMMGERMGFDARSLTNLEYAGLLHDVGKIGVPLTVLTKKGQLAREEMVLIRRHPEISAEILNTVDFLERVVPIIRFHHENMDGTGYPCSLVGEQIPLEARVLSVADAYDAMVSERPYRPPLEHWRAVEILKERAGSQFDAEVVGVFLRLVKEGCLAPLNQHDSSEEADSRDAGYGKSLPSLELRV